MIPARNRHYAVLEDAAPRPKMPPSVRTRGMVRVRLGRYMGNFNNDTDTDDTTAFTPPAHSGCVLRKVI